MARMHAALMKWWWRRMRRRERKREREVLGHSRSDERSVSTTPCRVTPPLGARAPACDRESYTPTLRFGLVARLGGHKGAQTSTYPSQSPSTAGAGRLARGETAGERSSLTGTAQFLADRCLGCAFACLSCCCSAIRFVTSCLCARESACFFALSCFTLHRTQ